MFCSFKDSFKESLSPPLLAKIRPKYDALSSTPSSSVVMSKSLLSNRACNSSNVMTASTYGFTFSSIISAFFAVQGPIKTTFASGVVSLIYLEIMPIGERLCEMYGTSVGKFFLM